MRRADPLNILQNVFMSMTHDDLFDVINEQLNLEMNSALYNGDIRSFAYQIIEELPHDLDEIIYDPDNDMTWYNQGLEDHLEEVHLGMSLNEIADIVDSFFFSLIRSNAALTIHNGEKKAIQNSDFILKKIDAYRTVVIRAINKI